MKRTWMFVVMILLTAGFSIAALAQTTGGQGRRPGRGMPRYDPSTEVTLKGTVEEVKQLTGRMAMSGTHLTLKAESGTYDVHLGPTAFLSSHKFDVAKGDQIEVIGSKVNVAGAEAVLAREVKKGDNRLSLRNAQGIPEWSGGRRSRTTGK